eukprot:818702-Prymnesium_polylepis.1
MLTSGGALSLGVPIVGAQIGRRPGRRTTQQLKSDMSTSSGADNGWRKRKPGNIVPPFKPRRAPSHLNTQ